MAALLALLIVVVALGFCLAPLLVTAEAGVGPESGAMDRVAALEAERARLVAAIRDADLDMAMGKISAADHQDMRRTLEADAVAVLARLEEERASREPRSEDPPPIDERGA